MPWIEVSEPFAKPPKLVKPKLWPEWTPPLEIDRGLAELVSNAFGEIQLDLDSCDSLEITDCSFAGTSLANAQEAEISVWRSTFERLDLSGLSFQTVRQTRFVGCKLVGTDLAGATLEDVLFENCALRHLNLRAAKLNRVRFDNCTIDDADLFEATITNVDFVQSTLSEVNVDRLNAAHVDLRDATQLEFKGLSNLKGCLVTEEQLPSLAYSLAFACDLGIEKPPNLD